MEVLKESMKTKKIKMMCKIIYIISIAALLCFFSSCVKDADVKLPAVESKLVINSFISPQDTIIRVAVTLSQPLYNNSNAGQFFNVSNASVLINDGVNSKTLIYNSIENYYSIGISQLPIVVGTTYYLTVSTPDGKNITATTSIPNANSTLTFSSHYVNDPNQQDSTYSITTFWNDSPGTEDYYRVSYYEKQFYPGAIDTSYSILFSGNYSDKDKDGTTLSDIFEVYKAYSIGNMGELYLIHATKEYYLYHTKLADAANSLGPFTEPVQMYSNINGGYGIFAGFNQYKLPVSL